MRKKRIVKFIGLVLLFASLSSCASKKIPYLMEATNETLVSDSIYESKIGINDELTIVVSTPTPEAAAAFNLITTPTPISANNVTASSSMYANLQTYRVEVDGTIDFPILGKLLVAGMTRRQLATEIKNKIYPIYLTEEPIIIIRYANFKIAVLGEVAHAGSFVVKDERLTIFDALAMAGDMTIYGSRKDVLVVREDDKGNKITARLDLQDKNIMKSPFYHLKQNDVVYVKPNKHKGNSASVTSAATISVSAVSLATSVATLLVNVVKVSK